MARTSVKSTYALDVETVKTLEAIARRWGVSKSEAIRRALHAAAERERLDVTTALSALEGLQKALALSPAGARSWAQRVRKERRTASSRRER
jgi:hypothetical protein